MPKFDPVKSRETLLGGIRFDLAADFNEISARGCLTGYGLGFHGTAIEAILVGFDEPAVWLLEKATRWLGAAIAAEEDQYSSTEEDPYRSLDGTRSLQYESMAQCNWLLTGVHDFENLRRAVHYTDRYYSDYAWESDDLGLVLPLYCEAREFARACEIFESVVENAGRQNPEDVRDEGSMAYVICLHRLGRAYSEEDLRNAAEGFLRRSVPDLLHRGHYPSVAQWMKLIFWDGVESQQAAWQSLLRCYDFLPGVARLTGKGVSRSSDA